MQDKEKKNKEKRKSKVTQRSVFLLKMQHMEETLLKEVYDGTDKNQELKNKKERDTQK